MIEYKKKKRIAVSLEKCKEKKDKLIRDWEEALRPSKESETQAET